MKKILVTIDFNERISHQVVDKAIEVATAFQAKVHLLHVTTVDKDIVVAEPGVEYLSPINLSEYEEEMKTLNSYKKKLMDAGIETDIYLKQGFADKTILKTAKEYHIDLIILGLVNHGTLYKTFVGSVSNEIIKSTDIPILLVPEIK